MIKFSLFLFFFPRTKYITLKVSFDDGITQWKGKLAQFRVGSSEEGENWLFINRVEFLTRHNGGLLVGGNLNGFARWKRRVRIKKKKKLYLLL